MILLLAYRHYAGNLNCKVTAWFGVGKNLCFYDINDISIRLGEQTCRALPFFHAFTGCDSVSSFFNQGKCKFWDRWDEFNSKIELTQVFCALSDMPQIVSDEQINIIEKYVHFVYYPHLVDPTDIVIERMRDFEFSTHNNLRLLPPSRIGLIQHIKRGIRHQCMENVELPDPQHWGWMMVGGQYLPQWQEINEPIDANIVTAICSCIKEKCNNCQCSRQNLVCLTFCKCKRHCLYTPI